MSFKICLVGCGNMSTAAHGPAIKRYVEKHTDTVFAACCDLDEARAKDFQEKFGAKAHYTCIDTMLAATKPDAVCLIAPIELTADISCQILRQGYPLILEKPPGLNASETTRMIQAAGNTPTKVAFNRRYMPLVQKLGAIIDELGAEILNISYRMLRVNRFDPDFSGTAIHGVDLVKHVADADYEEITFRYNKVRGATNYYISGTMTNGAVVTLDFLPVSGLHAEQMEVNTDKGTFSVKLPLNNGIDGMGSLTFYVDNTPVLEVSGREAAGSDDEYINGGFYHENALFFDEIKAGKHPAGDIAACMQSVEVASSLSRCLKTYHIARK